MPSAPDKTTAQRDLFRGALEMMILQSLRRQPMHGHLVLSPAES
jgi:PadR family transcriptional regulator PadR